VMSGTAVVILAHADGEQVRRLIDSLAGMEVFLHCDAKTPDSVLSAMTAASGACVHAIPRRRTSLASWSLVDAELAGVRMALERTRAEHIIVMSGSCYPLVSTEELGDDLARWRGHSRLELNPLPYLPWGTRLSRDGGLWRFDRRFVTFRDKILFVRGVPLPTYRRRVPRDLRLHASSQWKIYAREHAAILLRVLDGRSDLLRFWRTTLIPEESCAASILRSPALVGAAADNVCDDLPWYMEWPPADTRHPRWLGEEHAPMLETARFAPPRDPVKDQGRHGHRKLFARKLSSRASWLVDMIDGELRT